MEPLDYSNRPSGEINCVNLKTFDLQTHTISPKSPANMNMPNNDSKFQMNPMGHVYVQASSLMNSFMLQDSSPMYGSPSVSFAHLSHHFNSIRAHDQGQSLMTQPNPNYFQYPMNQSSANGSPVVSNSVSSISLSNKTHPSVPDTSVSIPVPGSQVSTSLASTPYSCTTMIQTTAPNVPTLQEKTMQDLGSSHNNTNSMSSSSSQWSDQSETSDTKLSAQQLRLQRETHEERERRLVAGRERMRLYRARERILESPEEKERRLAVARERTRLGRALENADQREKRLKKTRERLRMKRQMETQEERERRLKQHRENKRERYHKMSTDERSLLRHAGGQRNRPVSSGSSQSDCDLEALQRCSQSINASNPSLSSQWNNDMEGFSFGLDVKVEPDEILNGVDSAQTLHACTSVNSSLPLASSSCTAASSGTLHSTTLGAGGNTNQPSLRLPPDKAPHSQTPPFFGPPLHYPPLPNILGGSVVHPKLDYDYKPSPADILQATRPVKFASAVAPVPAPSHYSNSPHLALTNYNHKDLYNSLNPL